MSKDTFRREPISNWAVVETPQCDSECEASSSLTRMSKAIAVSLLLIQSGVISAQASPGEDLPDKFFNSESPSLTPQEKAGLSISKRWRASSATGMKPVAGADGTVQFLFGSTQPSVVCAVLQVCDIELQPGEVVSNFHAGDQVRWRIEPARSGSPEGEIEHVIVKPLDVGLRTSLIILDRLNFDYEVTGDASWKPLRVFNDGHKTILQMPDTLSQTEAPSLLVLRGEDSVIPWGDKAEQVMVNYRVQGNRYVVDSIPERMILVAGAGSHQNKVVITRRKL